MSSQNTEMCNNLLFQNGTYYGYYASTTYSLSGDINIIVNENDVTVTLNGSSHKMYLHSLDNCVKITPVNKNTTKSVLNLMFPYEKNKKNYFEGFYNLMEPLDCGKMCIFRDILEFEKLNIKRDYDRYGITSYKKGTFKEEYSQDSKLY